MKRTLLQVVQSVLGAMDSDAVDTIGETPESEQIALLASETFYEMAQYQSGNIPQFKKINQLQGLSDLTRATVMKIPVDATDILSIRYRHLDSCGKSCMRKMTQVDEEEFLSRQLCLDVADTDSVGVNILEGEVRIPYKKDYGPTCYTTIDDEFLIFDAIDTVGAQENTLHNDSSLVISYVVPRFELRDDFIIPLPEKAQTQYLAQVKQVAFSEQKQMPNPDQASIALRNRRNNQLSLDTHDGNNNGKGPINYGKRSRIGTRRSRRYRG